MRELRAKARRRTNAPAPRPYKMSYLTDKQIKLLNEYFFLNDDIIWLLDDYLFDPFTDPW